jgi:diguanylate cyclase (GGDEF)-like protein
MRNPSQNGLLYRFLLGDLADAPERVRERMLETIPTTNLSLAAYSFTLFLICGTAVWITRGAHWSWAWLALSVLLICWRALHPWIRLRQGHPRPLASIMLSSGLAMASFGFGCAMSIRTGDVILTTIVVSGNMCALAGIATRWAALPRPAIATMVASILPPMYELAMGGGSSIMAAVVLGLTAASIATFTAHNRTTLLASITAGELLRRKAETDHLTGLANRAELMQRLEDACGELPDPTHAHGRSFAILYVDLDGFKAINDNHGHAAGDEILQRVSACLRQVAGPEALVARIGGDEFVVLLLDSDPLTARAVSDEVINAISREHRISDGRALRVGCSVGVSMAPDQGRDAEVLLARADAALYSVKNQGKGQTGVWRALGEIRGG